MTSPSKTNGNSQAVGTNASRPLDKEIAVGDIRAGGDEHWWEEPRSAGGAPATESAVKSPRASHSSKRSPAANRQGAQQRMASLNGELVTETFTYDGGRQVTAYVPPDPPDAVVYAADGGWHTSGLAEALEAAGGPSTMLVGVHGLDDDEGRLKEYVAAFGAERFDAYEKFFVGDVRRWAQSELDIALPPERTAVWGASLGGELALAMGLRHPDVYGAVFCASPGGGFTPTAELPRSIPRTYLVGGKQEQWFLANAIRWADALREAGAEVTIMERNGAHGGAFWREEFPLMVSWAFGR